MHQKSLFSRVSFLLGALVLSGTLADGAVLYSDTVSLVETLPTQLGRLSRDGFIPDWSGPKPFPGILNPDTPYHYRTIPVFVPNWLSFLQITIDSNDPNIFASLYDTSYHPNPLAPDRGLDVNYLGDAGISGNLFGTVPIFFQVVAQTAANSSSGGGTVILVLNETVTNGGLNSPVGLQVEGFSDTAFNEVPEPVTASLLGAALLALAAGYRRRTSAG